MMDLVLDFGNTNQKLALFKDGLLTHFSQTKNFSLQIIREIAESNNEITHCILSSDIQHSQAIPKYLARRYHFIELTEKTLLPITNLYDPPDSLGKDRLAAAVAASSKFPGKPVLAIVMGTGITYNFINAKKEFLGGSISPGMEMRFRTLHTFTEKVPFVSYKEKFEVIGRNTENSVLSGVINGITAEIEGIAHDYALKYPGLEIILSGGDLNYFIKRLKISIFAFPNIVLHGLHQIMAFNVKLFT
jgi:type III pantothenate kinase